MERLLVQTTASDKDSRITDQKIEGVSFADYLHREGIKVLKDGDFVASCHGNIEFSLQFAEQIQKLADDGNKIVVIESGGLYFARSSLEAVHAPTVPFISVPLGGLDAFLAPNLPAGVAAIGGVGVGKYETAARVARGILLNEFTGVYIWGTRSKRLDDILNNLGLNFLGHVGPAKPQKRDGLLLGEVHPTDFERFDGATTLGIYSTAVDPVYTMRASGEMHHSVYVRGPENLAYFAAKIIALDDPYVRKNLKDAREAKAQTYKKPDITLDSFA